MIITEKQFDELNVVLSKLNIPNGFLNDVYPKQTWVHPKERCALVKKLNRNDEIVAIQKYLIDECNRLKSEGYSIDKIRPLMDAWIGYEEERLTYLKLESCIANK